MDLEIVLFSYLRLIGLMTNFSFAPPVDKYDNSLPGGMSNEPTIQP
jgi:hypothetical protein